jgi:exosome complex component CSL4
MSSGVLLPGDFVESFADGDRALLQARDGYFSSTVLGGLSQNQFRPLRSAIVPQVHDVVIGRVIRVRRKEAHLVLLTTNGQPLGAPLLAELRSVDIQEKEVDGVVASAFCHPGDLVRARVVALGRSGFYAQLSTAEDGMEVLHLTRGTM